MKIPSAVTVSLHVSPPRAGSGAASVGRLSILLVNHNGMQYLGPCLESIHRYAPPETQVILEDNASTDGSLKAAENKFSWLQIVRSSRNLGFAGGNNLAGKRAQGRFILLLNTDTLLLEPVAPVVDWLESHPMVLLRSICSMETATQTPAREDFPPLCGWRCFAPYWYRLEVMVRRRPTMWIGCRDHFF